ncbi:MAG: AbrB family transcriptional regulator [Rhodospirillales bacterium]|nr:AbrB family transcriptional regulator [Rhodospirillales bacterium]
MAADALRLPLAWMLGAMAATTAAALAGLDLKVPVPLRRVMLAVLGVMLGSAFTPEIAGHAQHWLGSLAGLAGFVVVATLLTMLYLRKVGRYGMATAYFASAPGGLNEMTIIGAAMGGDDRVISLTHALRILIIVFTVPVWFRLFGGYAGGGNTGLGALSDLGAGDLLVLASCAVAGSLLARLARLPAVALTGPMLVSAALHLSGITAARPPGELVSLAQVVLGAGIGCRFAGLRIARAVKVMVTALGSTAILLVLGLAATAGLAAWTGLPFAALLLAFVPGGLTEMCLISMALGIDVAFVSAHHFARIVLVVMLAPLAFRLFRPMPQDAPS